MKRTILTLAAILMALPALAAEIMSAPDARAAAERGEIALIDIRTPQEWNETGIADVATPITMHDRAFLSNLETFIAANPEKKIAFICAVGGRTGFIVSELEKRGFTNLIDVSEGMMGSPKGPGWLERGLPIKKP